MVADSYAVKRVEAVLLPRFGSRPGDVDLDETSRGARGLWHG